MRNPTVVVDWDQEAAWRDDGTNSYGYDTTGTSWQGDSYGAHPSGHTSADGVSLRLDEVRCDSLSCWYISKRKRVGSCV